MNEAFEQDVSTLPENDEAKQKEVFGFDTLLVVGATIVLGFLLKRMMSCLFVADILDAAVDELFLVHYRGFHQTRQARQVHTIQRKVQTGVG
jgi:hypothetical protein